ncbi:MAG: energy-coupling factor transport system substrate-specific component [Frankiales bacterium]|jgi:energy-coupling factor transport system substrate-specific component|nr:energy-coupling factor transport system substrate-specific component [Frankiales bacterium]
MSTNAVRLRPRSTVALAAVFCVGLLAFTWPLLSPRLAEHYAASSQGQLGHSTDAPWLFVLLLPLLLAVVLAELSEGGLDAKAVAMLGVLSAVGAALRPLGGGATGFTLTLVLLIPAGRVLGRGFGFVLGATTLLASALLTGGVGPWLPFQMTAAAWVGFFAGCLPQLRGRAEVVMLALYGAVAAVAYGFLMNLWFWPFAEGFPRALSYIPGADLGTNLTHWLRFSVSTSLGFDLPRAVTHLVVLLLVGRPLLLALRRAARRAAFDVPVVFEPMEQAA